MTHNFCRSKLVYPTDLKMTEAKIKVEVQANKALAKNNLFNISCYTEGETIVSIFNLWQCLILKSILILIYKATSQN